MDARSAILRGCFDTSRRTVVFILDQRDIAVVVDNKGRAHCIAGQILGALKEGNRFNCRLSRSLITAAFERLKCSLSIQKALNGEANGSVDTLATVLNTTKHSSQW